jgi:2-oxoglutarate dehydrogenase E2 component (dihydrolipoamide succinyltransferase)
LSGRVTKNDILSYLEQRKTGAPAAKPKPPAYVPPTQPEFSDERVEIIPMDHMRKSIAAHMVNSVQTSPHVFAVSEADMTNLVRYREQHKDEFQKREGFKLTYMPFIVQASAMALRDYPLVNSSVKDEKIVRKKYINVGMAVALENNGLIVPVIKGADGLNILGLARAVNDLALRARTRKLKPDEVQDGTFSITNMGSFGSIMGFPIINQPQVAILGVGVIQKRPVVINDAIAIRDMMYISLSFDHRIVDGALAGQFLDRIAYYLSNYNTKNLNL